MTYTDQALILSPGQATAAQITAYYQANAQAGLAWVNEQREERGLPPLPLNPIPPNIGGIIVRASKRWPDHVVNHDLLAVQGGKESAFLQSEIARDKLNPSGLGAENDNPYEDAITCESWQEGFELTVAHLLTYAAGPGPWIEVDPRAHFVPGENIGNVRTWAELGGTWAVPGIGYGASLAERANELLRTEVRAVVAIPTEVDIGYPVEVIWAADTGPSRPISDVRWFVIHKTEGNRAGDIPTLTKPTGKVASAHAWIGRDGTLVFMVDLLVTAWTSGNQLVDVRAINVELEGFLDEPTTEAQYRSCGAFFRWCELRGMDVPREFIAYEERPGIIGHMHVADPNEPSKWGGHSNHTDPGPLFEWDRLLQAINEELPSRTAPRSFETGYTIRGDIRIFWEKAESAGVAYQGFGLPVSAEYDSTHEGRPVVMQDFQRVVLAFDETMPPGWRVTALFRRDLPQSDAETILDQIRELVAA